MQDTFVHLQPLYYTVHVYSAQGALVSGIPSSWTKLNRITTEGCCIYSINKLTKRSVQVPPTDALLFTTEFYSTTVVNGWLTKSEIFRKLDMTLELYCIYNPSANEIWSDNPGFLRTHQVNMLVLYVTQDGYISCIHKML